MIQYVATSAGCLAALAYLLYRRYSWIKYDLIFLRIMLRLIIPIIKVIVQGKLLCEMFEAHTDQTPKKTYLIFKDQHYTFQFVDKQMNKMAHAAMTLGIKKGDTVALLMANEPAFIWTTYGNISTIRITLYNNRIFLKRNPLLQHWKMGINMTL